MNKLNDSLSHISIDFKNLLEEHTKKILLDISSEYSLDYEELYKRHVLCNESKIVEIKKKKKKSVELPDSSRCIANTAKYTRCTKSKLPGIQFCGFHKNKQQYGVVKSTKETIKVQEKEYLVNDNKLYLKEKLQETFTDLDDIDFLNLSIDSDGKVDEDGSLTLY
jgi:hypothetical protein